MGSINAVVDLQQDGDVAVVAMDQSAGQRARHRAARGADAGLRPPARHAGGEGGAADRHHPRLLRWRRHHRVRQAVQDADPGRGDRHDRGVRSPGGGRDLRRGAGRRPGTGNGLPLPGGCPWLQARPAGGQARHPTRCGRHAALAAADGGGGRDEGDRRRHPTSRSSRPGGWWTPSAATREEAVAFARSCIGKPLAKVRDRDEKLAKARANPALLDEAAAPLAEARPRPTCPGSVHRGGAGGPSPCRWTRGWRSSASCSWNWSPARRAGRNATPSSPSGRRPRCPACPPG